MTDKGISIEIVPIKMIDTFWPHVEDYLKKVVDISHGEVTLDGMYSRLCEGSEVIIVVVREGTIIGCCIIGITEFETGKRVMQMPYCGGIDMKDWINEGFAMVKQIAFDQNCTHIRGCGRTGWDRVLPDLVKIRTVYECEVKL